MMLYVLTVRALHNIMVGRMSLLPVMVGTHVCVFVCVDLPQKVNDVPVAAFVDSGAQLTIMSAACAQRCGYAHLRHPGVLCGVIFYSHTSTVNELMWHNQHHAAGGQALHGRAERSG